MSFFAKFECCTHSWFAQFSFTKRRFDTYLKQEKRESLTNFSSFKTNVFEIFLNLSRHVRFNSRNRNTCFFHSFTSESIANTCEILYANRKHVIDDLQKMRQNNAQIEHEFRLISNALKNFKQVQTRMNETAIVHESTIFEKRRAHFMNESNTIWSRTLKISSSMKRENKRSSRCLLKAKMKNLLRHRVYVDFDSNREQRQKAFAVA
jgi:hypothetical protein